MKTADFRISDSLYCIVIFNVAKWSCFTFDVLSRQNYHRILPDPLHNPDTTTTTISRQQQFNRIFMYESYLAFCVWFDLS